MPSKFPRPAEGGARVSDGGLSGPPICAGSNDGCGWRGSRMPAPHQCTLPTRCDRGCGPMRTCGLCRDNVHGGVVQVRAGGRAVAWLGAGAHRSKVRLWAHARRGRRETLDVPALKKGAIGLGCRTFYPSFEAAPCVGGSRPRSRIIYGCISSLRASRMTTAFV